MGNSKRFSSRLFRKKGGHIKRKNFKNGKSYTLWLICGTSFSALSFASILFETICFSFVWKYEGNWWATCWPRGEEEFSPPKIEKKWEMGGFHWIFERENKKSYQFGNFQFPLRKMKFWTCPCEKLTLLL